VASSVRRFISFAAIVLLGEACKGPIYFPAPSWNECEYAGRCKCVTAQKFADLEPSAKVEELSLEIVDGVDLGALKMFPHLRKLIILASPGRDLVGLESLNQIRELTIPGTATNLSRAGKLASLRKLTVEAATTNTLDLRLLHGLAELRELDIANAPSEHLDALSSLTHLKKLTLECAGRESADPIRELHDLEELALGGPPISDLQSLDSLEHLKRVQLGGAYWSPGPRGTHLIGLRLAASMEMFPGKESERYSPPETKPPPTPDMLDSDGGDTAGLAEICKIDTSACKTVELTRPLPTLEERCAPGYVDPTPKIYAVE
jgi:hypothetical protein